MNYIAAIGKWTPQGLEVQARIDYRKPPQIDAQQAWKASVLNAAYDNRCVCGGKLEWSDLDEDLIRYSNCTVCTQEISVALHVTTGWMEVVPA